MAGAATTGAMLLTKPRKTRPTMYLIKTSEVINEGDLVGLDTNGLIVVASKTQSAIVKAIGLAFFADNNGTGGARTGDGSTVKCAIAEGALLLNANSTLVPSLAKGAPVYLGPVPTSSVSNYTCALTSTNGDAIQQVGFVDSDGTTLIIDVPQTSELKYQTSGNSILTAA
jgi:hypothetical protein